MIKLKDIVGKYVLTIYEWRELDMRSSQKGCVYLRLGEAPVGRFPLDQAPAQPEAKPVHTGLRNASSNVVGIPHFQGDDLYPDFRIDRVLDTRAKSIFSKRKKIFKVKTPLAKKLKNQMIKHIYFDHHRGYYELENGHVISENLAIQQGVNAAGLVLYDSIEQLMALDSENVMQRLAV